MMIAGGYGKLIGAGGSPGMSSHRYFPYFLTMLMLMLMVMLMLMFLRYSPYSLPNFNSGAAMAAGLSAGAHQVHPQVGLLTYKLTLP